jgi:hypothetical protein
MYQSAEKLSIYPGMGGHRDRPPEGLAVRFNVMVDMESKCSKWSIF